MNKDSIINVCYLGIFFLVIMMFIPPIFRLVLPNENIASNNNSEQVNTNNNNNNSANQTLNCSLTQNVEEETMKFNVTTNHENGKIKMLIFKYSLNDNSKIPSLKEKVSLLKEFDNLKIINNVEYSLENNVNVLKFDYSKSDFSAVKEMQVYNKDLNTLKNYFVNLGFIC